MRVRIAAALLVCIALFGAPEPPARSSNPNPAPAVTATPGVEVIDHVVVLMLENRSADHYLGHLHDIQPEYEAQPATASNRDPLDWSRKIKAFHQTKYCELADLDHTWDGAISAFNDGQMDGFTAENQEWPEDPSGKRAMGYYTQQDIPYYYALYSTFATNDRYFSSMLGPTIPNRLFAYAATSWGMTSNEEAVAEDGIEGRSIFQSLEEHDVSWKIYYTTASFANVLQFVREQAEDHLVPISEYFADAKAGTLPKVAFIEPGYGGTRTSSDEHPPADMQIGQRKTSKIVSALLNSPEWESSAMFLMYDENGGYYDHVPPPPAVVPDEFEPRYSSGRFDRYGFRVPMVAISPYARRHYVSHDVQDHTSVLKFIETRFGLPPLTARDASADNMFDLFDFTRASFRTPPVLPTPKIDEKQLAACKAAEPLE